MKGRILYVHNLNVSFIERDIAILEQSFHVTRYFTDTRGTLGLLLSLVKQVFMLPWKVRSVQLVVIFFAGYHSLVPVLLAKLLRKPCLLMLGGADCYNFPSIDYGNYRKPLMGWATSASIRNASHLSTVHESLIEEDYTYDNKDFAKQGYKAFVSSVYTPETTIYLEYDPQLFEFRPQPPPERSFITVGFGMDGNTFNRKGVDLIIAASKVLTDCKFTIVGSGNPDLHANLSENVEFLQPVPYESLIELYQHHQYYLQLSMAEGFPSAICEAMLCGCIPIGSNVAAIPFIIGDTGFILDRKDSNQLVRLCQEALNADVNTMAFRARKRIEEICPPGSRAEKLTGLAHTLMNTQ